MRQDGFPVLDVGVGTGRIAGPLAERGFPVIGIDLSGPMLDQLRRKPECARVIPLLGDAGMLPFHTHMFSGAVVCHLFHLVSNWQGVLLELVRVVRPGCSILVSTDGSFTEHARSISTYFYSLVGGQPSPLGARSQSEIDHAAITLGLRVRTVRTLRWARRFTPNDVIGTLESGEWSSTWNLSDEGRRHAANVTRGWCRQRFGSLDAPLVGDARVTWHAYDIEPSGRRQA